jgi:TPR repeat protein
LAQLIEKGKGTKRDDAEAFQWYKKAADKGFASAQSKVSEMYARGQGVPANPEQAYFWSTLAAKQNEKNAERRSAALAANLSADAVARAQKSAGEWKPILATTR